MPKPVGTKHSGVEIASLAAKPFFPMPSHQEAVAMTALDFAKPPDSFPHATMQRKHEKERALIVVKGFLAVIFCQPGLKKMALGVQ